ncbi:FAD binding domain-containing protein [Apiospora marii]|uniref:FAD binding domain-containing protein n=1 Tax=Apiospora marii TaxID=335849 RepID=UPI003130E141
MLRLSTRLLALLACISAFATSKPLEHTEFDAVTALQNHGFQVGQYRDLASLASTSSNRACEIACKSLEKHFGADSVDRPDEATYTSYLGTYWSALQSDVHPYCIFKPSTPEDVSVLVLLSRLAQCPFAVRSGGHAAFAGASSIEGGITVSFQNLKGVALSTDKKVASVQPGNTWGSVYSALQKDDVAVIGGRIENIGVGGLTTGAMAAQNGTKIASIEQYYAEPDGHNSPAWEAFKDVPVVSDTRQNRVLFNYTAELQAMNPDGLREIYYGLSLLASADVLIAAKDIFYEEIGALDGVSNLLPVLACQAFTLPILAKMQKNGGNPLGLEDALAADRPVYVMQVAAWWDRQEDDAAHLGKRAMVVLKVTVGLEASRRH